MLRHRSSSLSKEDSRSQILYSSTHDDSTAVTASAAMILHKIKLLYENHRYEECALMIRRLSGSVIESILTELPIVDFINAIPQSFVILDSLYSKIVYLGPQCQVLMHIRPKLLVTHAVRWISELRSKSESNYVQEVSVDQYRATLRRLLRVLVVVCPDLKKELQAKKAVLEKCVNGLGQHGLVTSPLASAKLTTIHDALKNACISTIQCMKTSLHKLDDVGPSHSSRIRVSVQRDVTTPPVSASHQRQIQVTVKEVENRLILNKTLLDSVESNVTTICNSFDELLKLLRQRIESDKEVLFCLAELRREIPGQSLSLGCAVIPQIQRLINGYGIVINMLEEVAPDSALDETEIQEDQRGYTAENQTSSKNVICNSFAGESPLQKLSEGQKIVGALKSQSTSELCDKYRQEIERLNKEVTLTKKQLAACQQSIIQLQDREKSLVERLSVQALTKLEKSSTKFEDISLGNNRPTQLIRRYGNLYAESRVDVLDALDELPELDDMDDLKTKLLFSIVVLAFRSAEKSLKEFRAQLMKLLDMVTDSSRSRTGQNAVDPLLTTDVESSLLLYLRKTADRKNLTENVQDVCSQVWKTLFDYPSLKKCQGLLNFISETVHLAWVFTIQNPSYSLEFESERFSSDSHTHFHTSNSDSDIILTYIWPGLREGEDGPVVYRGVVIT